MFYFKVTVEEIRSSDKKGDSKKPDDKYKDDKTKDDGKKKSYSDSGEKRDWDRCKNKTCTGNQLAILHELYKVCYCDCVNTQLRDRCMSAMSYSWNDDTCKCTEKDANKMAKDLSNVMTDSSSAVSDIVKNLILGLITGSSNSTTK